MTSRAQRSRGMPHRSAPAEAAAQRRLVLFGIGGLLLVVVLAGLVAVLLSATPASRLAEPASASLDVTGTALPMLTDPAADPAVGLALPTLTGTDLAGEPISIGPNDGPMAIALMAHWCSHCQAEVPVLVDWLASTGMPDGVRMVALSTSIDPARPNYPPSAWFEREGWTVPTMVDDGSDSGLVALGMGGFPGFVFVDADGRVVQRLTGEVAMATFGAIVESLAP